MAEQALEQWENLEKVVARSDLSDGLRIPEDWFTRNAFAPLNDQGRLHFIATDARFPQQAWNIAVHCYQYGHTTTITRRMTRSTFRQFAQNRNLQQDDRVTLRVHIEVELNGEGDGFRRNYTIGAQRFINGQWAEI